VSRLNLHRLFVAICIVFVIAAVIFYIASIVEAPHGRSTAGQYDGYAVFAFMGAVLFGIIDFFIRPVNRRGATDQERERPLNG